MSLEDHDDYFIPGEFAVLCTVHSTAAGTYGVQGIMDLAYNETETGGLGIESRTPTLLVADETVPDLAEDDTVDIPTLTGAGTVPVTYTVRDIQPDGTGHSLLILDRTP